MKLIYCFFAAVVLMFSSCSDIKEYMALETELQHKYDAKHINVGITNKELTVTFINTPYNDSTDEVKQRVATEIGKMVPQYIHSSKIEKGVVAFEVKKSIVIAGYVSKTTFDMGLKQHQ